MTLTNNEQSAKHMLEVTGSEKPNCYNCHWCQDVVKHKFYRSCGVHVAQAIKQMKGPLLDILGNSSRQPLFPVIPMDLPDGSTEIMPSIIALEFGINTDRVFWPIEFDPIYILYCAFYTPKEDVKQLGQ